VTSLAAAAAAAAAAAWCCRQGLLGGYWPSLVAYTSSIMASMGGFAFPSAKMYAYR
jgi:hypothetical protein